jgi:diguanylate cyclase
MPPAPYSLDEPARLDALARASLLDTKAEPFFEDIVDSVQQVVSSPIVLISLVDEWRQWFKARRGLDVKETPRDQALCAHAILSDETLVVQDCRQDARFRDNPLVNGAPNFISYAGAPIVLENGTRLGTVCVIDHAPRQWSAREIAHIERHARLVARHIDARRAHLEQDRLRFLEASLNRSERRYQSVLESMSEGMVVHGRSGAIIDSNPAAADILGLSEGQLFGRISKDPAWRAITPTGEDFPGDDHPAMVTLRTGMPQQGVVMGVETPAGERRWLSINSYPVRSPSDGTVDQVVAIFHVLKPEEMPEPTQAEG